MEDLQEIPPKSVSFPLRLVIPTISSMLSHLTSEPDSTWVSSCPSRSVTCITVEF